MTRFASWSSLTFIGVQGHYAADVEAIVVETSRVAAHHWKSRPDY